MDNDTDRSARNDLVAGVFILAVVAIFAARTGDIYVDPFDPGFSSRDFPIGVLAITAALALGLIGRAVPAMMRAGSRLWERGEMDGFLRYVVPMIATGVAYLWAIEMFQYALPTVLAGVAALAVFGNRGWGRVLGVALAITLVYYGVFYGVLGMYETPGTVWSYDTRGFFRPFRELVGLM